MDVLAMPEPKKHRIYGDVVTMNTEKENEEVTVKCRFCNSYDELGTCGTCGLNEVCPDCFSISKCCVRRSMWVDIGDDC